MMKSGKREGVGVWTHRSGSRYEGEWKNNVKDGVGKVTFGYLGSFEEGGLKVVPDLRLWSLWQKGGPIGEDDTFVFMGSLNPSIFPAYMEVRVFNRGKTAICMSERV